MKPSRPLSIQAEIQFGENSEAAIVKRWARLSPHARNATGVVKTDPAAHLDFLVVDRQGRPHCYVEVKRRRTDLSAFGDVICPWTKHVFAKEVQRDLGVPVLLVTEYGCGSLVEVDLTERPSKKATITRRGRGFKPVDHAVYLPHRLTVLEGTAR